MTLPRYLRYKPTGPAWLGDVPEHWEVKPLWTLYRRIKRIGHAGEELLSVYRDHGVVPKASRDDNNNKASEDLAAYQLVEPGDLVLNKMKAWQGSVAVSAHRGIVSPAYFVYKSLHTEDSRYLHYLMRSARYITGYLSLSKGIRVNQWDLEPEYHSRMPVLLPPRAEQEAISAFLDRETAKIDSLIVEQEKLIALLAEKRQAAISHAVTKGLDPKVPMKDSGIAWLGHIPAHWEMKRVKDCGCEVVDCKNRTPEPHDDGDYFVVRTSCVKDGRFDPEPGYKTNEANFIEWTAKGRPQAGDVLFTREAPTGEACLAPEGLDFCLGQRMMYIRPPKHVLLSEFLLFSIYGGLARERISEKSKGSTVGHLRVGEVGELPLLLPPLDEQRALVDFVGTELSRLESLAAEAERAIALMKERRGALITAAVTGQVDVRNEIFGAMP